MEAGPLAGGIAVPALVAAGVVVVVIGAGGGDTGEPFISVTVMFGCPGM